MYLALKALDSGLLAKMIGIAWFLSEVFCFYSWIYAAKLLIKLLYKKTAQQIHVESERYRLLFCAMEIDHCSVSKKDVCYWCKLVFHEFKLTLWLFVVPPNYSMWKLLIVWSRTFTSYVNKIIYLLFVEHKPLLFGWACWMWYSTW
jgi:hypothetical protein